MVVLATLLGLAWCAWQFTQHAVLGNRWEWRCQPGVVLARTVAEVALQFQLVTTAGEVRLHRCCAVTNSCIWSK